ncbi:MAG TPA: GNAT family N-acetyltransferase, partial [Candidatus Kryptonia bacterium]|nr:GNAT family N-acetyltransferase [Candidatus Kryptonia bacterium]
MEPVVRSAANLRESQVTARAGGEAGAERASLAQAAIEPLAAAHISDVVRLHRLCYPTQFSTRLGSGVLTILYRSYWMDPNALGLVSVAEGRVVAAVCGVVGSGFQQRMVRRDGLALGWRLLVRVTGDPVIALEVARRAMTVIMRRGNTASEAHPRRFVWRSQTVDPECRGQGVIFPLIRAMLAMLRTRGVEEIYSTPDEDNQAAMWVHRVLNFERRGTQVS